MKEILNQVYEIEQKSEKRELTFFNRNVRRIYHEIEQMGFVLKNPLGEKYSLERTDIEANLLTDFHEGMRVSKVLKPIIYKVEDDQMILIQKGIVIVE